MDSQKHILILGAGFGGLSLCHGLKHPKARISLVDRQNHHLFQPLLYQVATCGLDSTDVAQPIRYLVSDRKDINVYQATVTGVDLAARRVQTSHYNLDYDYLVIALGGVTSYFGHPEWEEHAPGLKSLEDASRIRKNVLFAFEQAEIERDDDRRRRLMTIVVVGGGPTGVEMAGALAELAKRVLRSDFRHIDPAQARVVLIESTDYVLGHMGHALGHHANESLRRLGVEVRTGLMVDDIKPGVVHLSDGEIIEADNIVWAAGVGAHPLTRQLGLPPDGLDRAGRIRVEPDLSLPNHPEVFAVGDLAYIEDEHGNPVPGVSPAAMQMSSHAAKQIRRELENGSAPGATGREPFRYWNKGTMATIGRNKAVAMIGRLQFSGFLAWFLWLFVHLVFIIDLKNRIIVFIKWTFSYLTYARGARIFSLREGEAERFEREHP
ncbi:MAG: NAD(P)/FAD-dependent oxidoreductase [Verrucomicrobiota bacterium]